VREKCSYPAVETWLAARELTPEDPDAMWTPSGALMRQSTMLACGHAFDPASLTGIRNFGASWQSRLGDRPPNHSRRYLWPINGSVPRRARRD